MNPYGEAPMANPRNIRQAMNGMDPRQRGLFAAAWSVGFTARFAQEGASALTLGGTVGEFGIAYAKGDYPQPWFDEAGGVYPVFHAIKGLAALRGQPLVDLVISNPCDIQAIAAERDGQIEIWLANLTDQAETVEFRPKLVGRLSVLSAGDPGSLGDALAGTTILWRDNHATAIRDSASGGSHARSGIT
jgi:hypothetical protein